MNNYAVQIIIPVYNSGQYLRRCLDSLTAQTFENWQAIIIDDGSTDDSAVIIGEYTAHDERFIYIKQQNSGVSSARNNALTRLDAEYAAFLDSDDYWESDMLAILYGKAKEYNADIVQCRYLYDYTSGRKEYPKGAFKGDTVLNKDGLIKVYRKMMTGISMNHVCMKLIRTDIIGSHRFDTSLKTAEDLHFCVRLFGSVRTYCFVDKPLYHYCRNENSITGKGLSFTEKLKANRYVSKEMAKVFHEIGIDSPYHRFLTYARPYTIIFSKIIRMLREKIK